MAVLDFWYSKYYNSCNFPFYFLFSWQVFYETNSQNTYKSDEWFSMTQYTGWLLPLWAGSLKLPVQAASKSADLCVSIKVVTKMERDQLPQAGALFFFFLSLCKMGKWNQQLKWMFTCSSIRSYGLQSAMYYSHVTWPGKICSIICNSNVDYSSV